MRKVIVSMMLSVDGRIEAADPEQDWFTWDEEMEEYMRDFMSTTDTFLYGRVAYEAMVSYWPNAVGDFADIMNNMPKIIFSRNLEKVEWKNARLMKGDIAEQLRVLKQQPGKDLVLFAGANIASYFIGHDLIDEYRLIINPVILGAGKSLFTGNDIQRNLELIGTQTFTCGNVLHRYLPHQNK